MTQETIDAVISGLKGEFIHSDPLVVLNGLTPEVARKRASGYDHSIWDLLYHTVLWNDIFLDNIKGNISNWNPTNNWPDPKELEDDGQFTILLKTFDSQLEQVRILLHNPKNDFNKKQKISTTNNAELSIIKLYITILQHISYHIGQIACIRKIVSDWTGS